MKGGCAVAISRRRMIRMEHRWGGMQRSEKGEGHLIHCGDKRPVFRKSAPAIIARVEGLHEETGWIRPTSASASTCGYLGDVLRMRST